MNIEITKGKQARAQRVVIYGTEGIGKSTLAAQFPDPVFIDTEGSTSNMDVKRFGKPTSWTMLMNEIAFVKANPGCCKTLVIDTVDWAEQLCVEHVCAFHGKKGIEDFGYGNGYTYVREEMGRLLNKLQELVDSGVHVVLTAHSQLRKFERPEEEGAYDRYELKLGKKTGSQTSPLIKEWADIVLFCNYQLMVVKSETNKAKAYGGERFMYTTHHPAWDAKNRHGLPPKLPMDYASIAHIFEAPAAPTEEPQLMKAAEPIQEAAPVVTGPAVPVQEAVASVDTVVQAAGPAEPVTSDPFAESSTIDIPDIIPAALKDLMLQNSVSVDELQLMAFTRGHFPQDTPIENFPQEYWGAIVSHWDQSMEEILKNRNAKN